MTKKGVKCPHCGVVHSEYVRWGKISSPRCMRCNKLVSKNLVPNKYVQHRPKKSGKMRGMLVSLFTRKKSRDSAVKGKKGRKGKKAVKKEEKITDKEEEKMKKDSLFINPKTPQKILEGVLRDFGCKEGFIEAMVRRSERTRGMYPGDLRHYLTVMNSGIGSKGQAEFIADEYSLALSAERDKASNQELKTSYPVEPRMHERHELPPKVGRRGYYAEYSEGKNARSYNEPHRARREREERLSRGDVRTMLEDALDRRERKSKREKRLSRGDVRAMLEDSLERRERKREREEVLGGMGNRITRIESDMANVPSRINEGISKVLEKSKKAGKPSEITKADLNTAVNNAALNLEKKYIEKDFEKNIKESKERERDFQKTIDNLSKERNELLTKLTTRKTAELSGYQSDSGRVIGEAVSGLKDVIATREPVKLVVEGLPRLLYPTTFAKGEKKPVMKEEKIVGGGVSKYLDNEYVEEE